MILRKYVQFLLVILPIPNSCDYPVNLLLQNIVENVPWWWRAGWFLSYTVQPYCVRGTLSTAYQPQEPTNQPARHKTICKPCGRPRTTEFCTHKDHYMGSTPHTLTSGTVCTSRPRYVLSFFSFLNWFLPVFIIVTYCVDNFKLLAYRICTFTFKFNMLVLKYIHRLEL